MKEKPQTICFVEQRSPKFRNPKYCKVWRKGKNVRFMTAAGHGFALDAARLRDVVLSLSARRVGV